MLHDFPLANTDYLFLKGGGEMGALMRSKDWTTSVVGPPDKWPQSLKTTLSIILNSKFPMFLFWGPELTCFYNDAYRPSLGRDGKHPAMLGAPAKEFWQEIWEFIGPLIDNVLAGGEASWNEDQLLPIYRNGKMEDVYWTFSYSPVSDESGTIAGVFVTCSETTDKVLSFMELNSSNAEQQSLNEEITAINEELATGNEELNETNNRLLTTQKELEDSLKSLRESEEHQSRNAKDLQHLNEWISASNEDLTRTQYELEALIVSLGESEARFRFLVQQAPVAIFILKGRELQIEVMNTLMLKMLGKTIDVVGKTYSEAMPEFEGQPFFKLLDDVFTSGQPFHGNEILAKIDHGGAIKDGYYNFIYEPIKDDQGVMNSVMCVAVDVTEQVNARKEIERAEESLRLAVDAAELASYYIDIDSRIFVASPRLKEFFGYHPDDDLPYEAAINTIHIDYRQAAADLVEKAITEGVKFDMEYPVVGHHDGKIRWVRGVGTVQQDNSGVPRYFTGVLHDITERKQDDTRKSDFIGMVSHELKTPLTTLTALVQVANMKLKESEDTFLTGAMEKATLQVKKMSQMINGFLNISRLESGKIVIEKQDFDIGELIEDAIEEQELITNTHPIRFSPCGPVMVHADRDKLNSVLTNLIGNAVKYSPKGKLIDIKCQPGENAVQISIGDEGIGIKSEDLDNVFKRYFRVANNRTQHISGFGIGLYLSAEIIHRHDGSIWAESEEGKGSTFYFSLPLREESKRNNNHTQSKPIKK